MKCENMCSKRIYRLTFLIFLCVVLSSCVEIRYSLILNPDGSGKANIEFLIPKDMEYAFYAAFYASEDSLLSSWKFIGKRQEGNTSIFAYTRDFKNVAELNSNSSQFAFKSWYEGFHRVYEWKAKVNIHGIIPIPFELVVKMPGNVVETNGAEVSKDTVKFYFIVRPDKALEKEFYIKSKKLFLTEPLFLGISIGILVFILVVGITLWIRKSKHKEKAA